MTTVRRFDRHRGTVRAAEDLKERLGRYASLPRFNEEFEEAFEYYFGDRIETLQEYVDENSFGRFMEWFMHDYTLRSGHRMIDLFELEHAAEGPRSVRRLLRSWSSRHLSLLEFQADLGEVLQLYDLLTGETYLIAARAFPGKLPPWSVVLGRVLPAGRRGIMSIGYTVLPPAAKIWLIPLIRGEYRRWLRRNQKGGAADFLRRNGHLFNDFLVELDPWIDASLVRAVEVHNIVRSQAVFKIRDRQKVVRRLASIAEIQRIDDDQMVWFEPAGKHPRRPWAKVSLGDERMHVTCWSLEGLQEAKELVARHCVGLIDHLLDVYEEHGAESDFEAALSRIKKKAQPHERLRLIEALKQIEYAATHVPKPRFQKVIEALVDDADVHESVLYTPLGERPEVWNSDRERQVVRLVQDALDRELHPEVPSIAEAVGESAEWLWWSFCGEASPNIRNAKTWAAALYYCVGYVEQWALTQKACAEYFEVSPSSVSKHVKRILETLHLEPFDERFCVRHPLDRLLDPAEDNGYFFGESAAELLYDTVVARNDVLWHATRVRYSLFETSARYEGLKNRAHELFLAHLPGAGLDERWDEAFLDWFHLDWRVPVLGGRTLAQIALDEHLLPDDLAEVLKTWIGAHPSFYVINERLRGAQPGLQSVVVRDIIDSSEYRIDALPLTSFVAPGDVMFARLVPVNDAYIAVGTTSTFSSYTLASIKEAIAEERALVDRWLGEKHTWSQFRARHAERLYALAYRRETEESLGY